MMRLGPLFLLLLALASPVIGQPGEEPFFRAPGSRTRTAAEEARYFTGVDELQPEVLRPADFARLSPEEARVALSEFLSAQPERSLESLLEGFERYRSVRERLRRLAEAYPEAIRLKTIGAPNGLQVEAVELLGQAPTGEARTRVLVTGGIHSGTEVVGMESTVRFIESAVKDPALRGKFDMTLVPLVNPSALVLGTRENLDKVDINRRFLPGKWTPETRMLADFVRTKTFDVALDLHAAGDPGRNGFFLISGQADKGMGQRIMSSMPSAALLDVKPGETSVGPYRVRSLGVTTIESIKGTAMDLLVEQGTPYVYTFEAPTRADPELQVRGTLKMMNSALNNTRQHGALITEVRDVREARPTAQSDRLSAFRNADGTLNWRALRGRAAHEGAGLANFGLALFLKELAVVAKTGDRARIEEFFQGLMTTEFYKEYGLFVLGARAGEVAYVRYLERFVKPRFVNGILRTNLVLAAGLALPRIADGTFSGKAFVISLTSLGISSAAVSTGMASIRWVTNLKTVRDTSTLSRLGLGASRFAKLGGWFYKAAELAVVLVFRRGHRETPSTRTLTCATRAVRLRAQGWRSRMPWSIPQAQPIRCARPPERFHEGRGGLPELPLPPRCTKTSSCSRHAWRRQRARQNSPKTQRQSSCWTTCSTTTHSERTSSVDSVRWRPTRTRSRRAPSRRSRMMWRRMPTPTARLATSILRENLRGQTGATLRCWPASRFSRTPTQAAPMRTPTTGRRRQRADTRKALTSVSEKPPRSLRRRACPAHRSGGRSGGPRRSTRRPCAKRWPTPGRLRAWTIASCMTRPATLPDDLPNRRCERGRGSNLSLAVV